MLLQRECCASASASLPSGPMRESSPLNATALNSPCPWLCFAVNRYGACMRTYTYIQYRSCMQGSLPMGLPWRGIRRSFLPSGTYGRYSRFRCICSRWPSLMRGRSPHAFLYTQHRGWAVRANSRAHTQWTLSSSSTPTEETWPGSRISLWPMSSIIVPQYYITGISCTLVVKTTVQDTIVDSF